MDITLVINEHKWVFAYDSICCGMCRIYTETEFFNPNIIKIVFDENKNLLYASRSPIPGRKKCEFHQEAYKQVCIYAFTGERLEFFSSEEQGYLEKNEEIEMLRFMERGGSIRMVEVSANSISVDIPDDADRVRQILKGKEELCKNF
jgi:3-deoxy-manno-octulosonate cytidylyltransferase (CMP-KDO synthetase)